MIIVDTCVWVEYLKLNRSYIDDMKLLLESRLVLAFEPVFSELMYGVKNQKEKYELLEYWKVLPKLQDMKNLMLESAINANSNNYHNLGIGLIDSMIITCAKNMNSKIWTIDKKIIQNLPEKFLYNTQGYQ